MSHVSDKNTATQGTGSVFGECIPITAIIILGYCRLASRREAIVGRGNPATCLTELLLALFLPSCIEYPLARSFRMGPLSPSNIRRLDGLPATAVINTDSKAPGAWIDQGLQLVEDNLRHGLSKCVARSGNAS